MTNAPMPARVRRKSLFTGINRTLELPQYTQDEFERRMYAYQNGHLLLDEAFPELSKMAREFIRTGATPEEWRKYQKEVGDLPTEESDSSENH